MQYSQSFNVVSWELTPNLICAVFFVACHCFEFWAYVSVIYKEEVLCYSVLQDGGGVSPHKKRRCVTWIWSQSSLVSGCSLPAATAAVVPTSAAQKTDASFCQFHDANGSEQTLPVSTYSCTYFIFPAHLHLLPVQFLACLCKQLLHTLQLIWKCSCVLLGWWRRRGYSYSFCSSTYN